MPGRDIPLVSGEIYHIINRGIARQPIYLNRKDYLRFFETVLYYQNKNIPVRYSQFVLLSVEKRSDILISLSKQKKFIVDLICYCMMPNHFHLVLLQNEDGGIAKFISNLSNSYTRYFNVKNKRNGPIFQGKFKAVRIEDDEQLLHVVRYIHLNPYTSFLLKNVNDVLQYQYSSICEYLNSKNRQVVNKELVLSQFKTKKSFRKFTLDQADYQRKLENIKHLRLES